jgi:hypothetical protein
VPSVAVKFREWNALLSRVYGSGIGDTELFLRHTYLTMLSRLLVAKALAPQTERKSADYAGLVTGEFFKAQNVLNLAEPDFFSWAIGTAQQKSFAGFLAKLESYLKIYDLSDTGEDILKEVYQELVDPESRHALGEYYTPDWLADLTLERISYEHGRLLDPACGSGSFLLAAIRRKRTQGLSGQALLKFTLDSIIGIDVHPVAVLMTKANLILGLVGELRKRSKDVYLPVYMADTLLVSEDPKGERIIVRVSEDEEFNIPLETIRSQTELDPLVDKITTTANLTHGDPNKVEQAARRLAAQEFSKMSDRERWFWSQNFKLMVRLMAEGRDTVFGYILKNAYRPAFVRQNKVDYVVGNPPWLSYRYIQDQGYKKRVKELTFSLKLLGPSEVKLFTQMDTSTLFFAYCEREFLKPGGTIAFVLPKTTTLPAKQHAGFQARGVSEILDFTDVTPLFNVRSVVVIRRPGEQRAAEIPTARYEARLPTKNMTWRNAQGHFQTHHESSAFLGTAVQSEYYYNRFLQGATLVPRCFWFVQHLKGAARNITAPHLETNEEAYKESKPEWRLRLRGRIEPEFLFETVLAKGLLPFHVIRRELVFLPVRLLRDGPVMADSMALVEFGTLHAAEWMQQAELRWAEARRGKEATSLHDWLNYTQKIVKQDASAELVVLYNTSGTNLSAAVFKPERHHPSGLPTHGFIADAKTYYYYPKTISEAEYLVAVLNSDLVNRMIKEFQPQGLFGERDIHRRPFEVCAIPVFDSRNPRHQKLAKLARQCAKIVAKSELTLTGTLARRRAIARRLVSDQIAEIDDITKAVLTESQKTGPPASGDRRSQPGLLLFDLL